jgi:uncharacterized membrane protein YkvA (DUF1232 family)
VPSLTNLRERVRQLKSEIFALYLAARHPETPWYAKVLVAVVVAYALSPIDLIPDFVPLLGYVDDLILIPVGITLAVKMIPPHVLAECRAAARDSKLNVTRGSRVAAAVIVGIWLTVTLAFALWTYEAFASSSMHQRR